jgi:hypothetical protein
MNNDIVVKDIKQVTVRFSGDWEDELGTLFQLSQFSVTNCIIDYPRNSCTQVRFWEYPVFGAYRSKGLQLGDKTMCWWYDSAVRKSSSN